ncbi:MAG TPA: phenylalanine--tRNA ligase subunit beta [Acidiferrobacter sp.]|nr:phenylalanine--tRNA ligase subunit beta [Acidiferrobacter sp.]
MRISEQWLSEWVDTKIPFDALPGYLVAGGFEVEGSGTVGPALAHVVVGRIQAIAPHPDAERLRVCEVEAGAGALRTIVCGAPNARVGLLAPLALPGAVVGEHTIAITKLRGVRSEGMLCSGAELGVPGAAGLWELPADAPVGALLGDYLQFSERYLDVGVTPNRGDCLSIAGLAREIAALTVGRYRARRVPVVPTSGIAPTVSVAAAARCPHYCARTLTGIKEGATSPAWLVERLRLSGIGVRHPVVDAANYVMLDVGQPLHAFDADLVHGPLQVRLAVEGEAILLLDGTEPTLRASDLVIADDLGPVAIAGVMGGARAAVSAQTRTVVLEAAYFQAETLSGTARRLGLITDAALRFERGVDPELASVALAHVSALIQKIAGGSASPIAEHVSRDYWPRHEPITLRLARIRQLLGVVVPMAQVTRFLKSLKMTVTRQHGDLLVLAPRFRFDIRAEIDLIEEIARLWGYDQIPAAELLTAPPPTRAPTSGLRRAADLLVDRDYYEAMTFSLVDPAEQALLGVASGIGLRNPLAAPWAELRKSLIPGLLTAALYNRHRQQGRVRLFEVGTCFAPLAHGVAETMMVAGLVLGAALPEQWGAQARAIDFFDLKGDVEALCALAQVTPVTVARDFGLLQSGLSAALMVNGESVGLFGALSPEQRERLGFDEPVFVFEIAAHLFGESAARAASEPSRFPSVRRDIAVVVAEDVAAGALLGAVRQAAGPLLQELVLFDVYRGEGLDLGKKSLALGLTLQDFSRTLKDEVADLVLARVTAALEATYEARLRQ